MYPKIPNKPEGYKYKEITEQDVLDSFYKIDRNKVFEIADELFSQYGENGYSSIVTEISSAFPILMSVTSSDVPGELKIHVNPKEIVRQVNHYNKTSEIFWDLDDYLLSAFMHEVSHAHGKYDFKEENGILEVHAGFDYRISPDVKVDLGTIKSLDDFIKLMQEYILFSGTLINESFTDYNAFKMFKLYYGNDVSNHNFYPGYSNLAELLSVFLDFFANAFDIKYSWTNRKGIEEILMNHYVSGQMLLDHSEIYSSVKWKYLETLRKIFISGQAESAEVEYPKTLVTEMRKILEEDGVNGYAKNN